MKSKVLAAVVLIVAVIAGAFYLSRPANTNPSANPAGQTLGSQTDNTTSLTLLVTAPGKDPQQYVISFTPGATLKSVMDSLSKSSNFTYATQSASFGEYVTSVNGITADSKANQFWNLKINGLDSTVGIADLKPAKNDWIVFNLASF